MGWGGVVVGDPGHIKGNLRRRPAHRWAEMLRCGHVRARKVHPPRSARCRYDGTPPVTRTPAVRDSFCSGSDKSGAAGSRRRAASGRVLASERGIAGCRLDPSGRAGPLWRQGAVPSSSTAPASGLRRPSCRNGGQRRAARGRWRTGLRVRHRRAPWRCEVPVRPVRCRRGRRRGVLAVVLVLTVSPCGPPGERSGRVRSAGGGETASREGGDMPEAVHRGRRVPVGGNGAAWTRAFA